MSNENHYAPDSLDFDNTFIPKGNLLLENSTYVMEFESSQTVMEDSQLQDHTNNISYDGRETLMQRVLEETKLDQSVLLPKEKETEEKPVIPQLVSSPTMKLSPVEGKTEENEKSSMEMWAELQTSLKRNYFIMKTESQLKQKVTEELNQLIKEYYKLHLRVRENNERIKKKLSKEDIINEEVIKIILDDKDNPLGDATLYAKSFLSLIQDQPKILSTLVKNPANASTLKALEETLCTAFYEDIIAEDAYDDGLLRLLSELLEGEFAKANKHNELFLSEHFTNKMCTSYLKRKECRRYIKTMLKDPIIATLRESSLIQLNPDDIRKQLESKQKAKSGFPLCVFKSDSKSKSKGEKSKADLLREKFQRESSTRKSTELLDDSDIVSPPTLVLKRHKSEESSELEESKINQRTFFSTNESFRNVSIVKPISDPEVMKVFDRSCHLIKKHLSILIQSIFDNLQSMPVGLRILCKIIYQLSEKKFPHLGPKEYNEILFTYLFRKWISPTFISPVHNGILDDFPSSEASANNLMEIAKVMQVIFSQNLYPAEDVKAALNPYILEIQPSVVKYFEELTAISNDLLLQIRQEVPESHSRIKSRSMCISLHEMQLLCEAIHKQKEQIVPLSHDALILTEKLLYYSQEHRIFGDKVDPSTGKKLKPTQCYVLFTEFTYPPDVVSNYLEEFNKIQGFSKNLLEEEKVIYRARHLLKQFLISIQDIKSIMKLAEHGHPRLDDVLERYQDKLYSYQLNQSIKDNMPLHVTARFLATTLQELDESYVKNNYSRLYQEMTENLNQVIQKLESSISSIKLQLLNALENLKLSCKMMQEINQKKIKAIEKSSVKEFIAMAHIPCCITSPSIITKLEGSVKKKAKKALATSIIHDMEEIVLRDTKGCLHEKSAIKESPAKKEASASNSKKIISQENAAIIQMSHCDTIDGFIHVFGNLSEVRDAMKTGKDHYGVNKTMITYNNKIEIALRLHFKNLTEEKLEIMMDKIENYICKRLYTKIFPVSETEADKKFWRRCKLLEWTNFDHLEVLQRNRCQPMWEYAAKVLNEIDNKVTPLEKLNCIVECAKTVIQVLELASTKESGGGADETLPIMLYVLLLAAPKRIHSNINFITLMRDNQKMQAREGYCFTQVVSAVMTIEVIDHNFYKMKEEEFSLILMEKELLYGLRRK